LVEEPDSGGKEVDDEHSLVPPNVGPVWLDGDLVEPLLPRLLQSCGSRRRTHSTS
jgi:hypothetical protein